MSANAHLSQKYEKLMPLKEEQLSDPPHAHSVKCESLSPLESFVPYF